MENELTTYREGLGTTNIRSFVIRGLASSHHLREHKFAALGADLR
jgi:hypothetical protein